MKGKYKLRDPRFVTKAKDLSSHIGYQIWHRYLDMEIIKWIDRHPRARHLDFEIFLSDRYEKYDLISKYPNGI